MGTQDATTIAVIGCGNMGSSLVGGLIASGHPAARLRGADPEAARRDGIAARFGIRVTGENETAIAGAQVVVLAVKPQAMKAALAQCAAVLRRERPLLISIAAGIPISTVQRWAGAQLPIVRAMPNTPALIGAGAAALYASPGVTPAQREEAAAVLGSTGSVVWVEEEPMLDVVTALSGSGPAYFFLLMEALENAAAELGLPAGAARRLTIQTALGAARMAAERALDPKSLRNQVTSPGGTTEQALRVLEQGGFTRLVGDAVRAARARAAELGGTLGGE